MKQLQFLNNYYFILNSHFYQGCKQFLNELTKKITSQKKKEQQMYKKMLNLEEEKTEKEKKVTSFGEQETTWMEVINSFSHIIMYRVRKLILRVRQKR